MALSIWDGESVEFNHLLGKTFTAIENNGSYIKFIIDEKNYYVMEHHQDCCESVYVEDISGDIDNLVGSKILHAEASTKDDPEPSDGVGMWTFYKLATQKGWVDIRWYGESNGYYGVSVDLTFFDVDKIVKEKYNRGF